MRKVYRQTGFFETSPGPARAKWPIYLPRKKRPAPASQLPAACVDSLRRRAPLTLRVHNPRTLRSTGRQIAPLAAHTAGGTVREAEIARAVSIVVQVKSFSGKH